MSHSVRVGVGGRWDVGGQWWKVFKWDGEISKTTTDGSPLIVDDYYTFTRAYLCDPL